MNGLVTGELLTGRKYFFIRGLPDTEVRTDRTLSDGGGGAHTDVHLQSESGKDAQIKFAKEYLETVDEWSP